MTTPPPSSTVTQWLNGLRIGHRGHIEAAKRAERAHLILGCATTALGVATATAIFANLMQDSRQWLQVLAGGISLLAVSLAVIQTFLNLSGAAASHRAAATGYGTLRRRLEQELIVGQVPNEVLTETRINWDRLDRDAPVIPSGIYEQVFAAVVSRANR
jgi:hypothetical protein